MATKVHTTEEEQVKISRRIVCELHASTPMERRIRDAIATCEEHDAELHLVWVLEPRLFGSPFPTSVGAVGTLAIAGLLRTAIEQARQQGIPATAAIRIGETEVALRQHAPAADNTHAEPTTTRDIRCPTCGWLNDPRAVHYCPAIHRNTAPPQTGLTTRPPSSRTATGT